jgi:hypothetical protein
MRLRYKILTSTVSNEQLLGAHKFMLDLQKHSKEGER